MLADTLKELKQRRNSRKGLVQISPQVFMRINECKPEHEENIGTRIAQDACWSSVAKPVPC
jgi:hypothetical protein